MATISITYPDAYAQAAKKAVNRMVKERVRSYQRLHASAISDTVQAAVALQTAFGSDS